MSRRVMTSAAVILAALMVFPFEPAGFWPTVMLFTLWAIGIRVTDLGFEARHATLTDADYEGLLQ